MPAHRDLARGGLEHAADALEQRRLARAVAAEDADGLALLHVEGDVVEGPEVLDVLTLPAVDEPLLERVVLLVVQPEALGDVLDVDGEVAHRSELLGEVALEAAEHGEGDQEQAHGEDEDDEVEHDVHR